MGPFELLFNVIQIEMQQSLLFPTENDKCTDSREAIDRILESREGVSGCKDGAAWLAIAEMSAGANPDFASAIRSAVQSVLVQNGNVSIEAASFAVEMWLNELQKIAASLRRNPGALPKPLLDGGVGAIALPTGLLDSDDDVLKAFLSPDPSQRIRACMRFLSKPQLAQDYRATIQQQMETETESLIRKMCTEILAPRT